MNPLPFRHHASPPPHVSDDCAGTIFFVEDEAGIRTLAKMYLERDGYRVIAAYDGVEALTLWQTCASEVDVMVVDLMMPRGINGQQLVQRLKADRPDIPVIFTSGYSSEVARQETFQDVSARFLPKPYRLKSLVDVVRESLQQRKPGKPKQAIVETPSIFNAAAASTALRRCRVKFSGKVARVAAPAQLRSAA